MPLSAIFKIILVVTSPYMGIDLASLVVLGISCIE